MTTAKTVKAALRRQALAAAHREDDPVFKKPKLAALFEPSPNPGAEFNAEKAKVGLKKRRAKVRESHVESDGKARVAKAGGYSAKFKSPGHRSRPDQIEFYGIAPMVERMKAAGLPMATPEFCRELLACAIQLTEYKKPGEEPTAAQLRDHNIYLSRGFTVNVIDQRTTKEKP